MEEKIINIENIKEEEVEETVTRVKAIILNSKNEILLGYSYGTYQFPGGHIEGNEELIPALNRELLEETGLDFDLTSKDINPFYSIKHYSRNYRNLGHTRKNIIHYFLFYTDTPYDKENIHLDPIEKEGDFVLKYVDFNTVEELLKNSIPDNEINKIIVEEMLEVIDIVKTKLIIK